MELLYEAELGLLSGAQVATNHAGFSGGGFVDYVNPTGDFVEFTVDVDTAGDYELSFRYALSGGGTRPLSLDVDGAVVNPSLDFSGTGGWSNWQTVNVPIALTAGTHAIRLTATGSSGPNLDNLTVAPVDLGTGNPGNGDPGNGDPGNGNNSGSTVLYEAESGLLSGAQTASNHTGFSGQGFVDYINPTGDFVEFTIDVESAGDYDLSFRYALGSNASRPLALAIDGTVVESSLDFSGTGGWNSWQTVDVPVNLTAGTHTVRLTAIGNSGPNLDSLTVAPAGGGGGNPGDDPGTPPISLLPPGDVRVEGNVAFDFSGSDGGLQDTNGDGLGFTMVDPATNPSNPNPPGGVVGYRPELLDVAGGLLQLTATPGIQFQGINTLDNALGVGLNVPSQAVRLQTTLVDLPAATGGFAQAGLWFGRAEEGGRGTSEDDYIKLVVQSPQPGNYIVEALLESNGQVIANQTVDIPDNPAAVDFELFVDPGTETVTAAYSVGGGVVQPIATFDQVPTDWFGFDQAGIDPTINTRSFGGVFATQRNAGSSQVFSFDDFEIAEETPGDSGGGPGEPPSGEFAFDRWSIPLSNGDRPTAMDVGPDGTLYVATLFGAIHAISFDLDTRTWTDQVIDTIQTDEGGNRLTLGLAVDPDSTPGNVVLWVGHSDGSVNNGVVNSAKISRLSGSNLQTKQDVVTGLPRAIANHALNNIDFGPNGKLYLWQGGNTGAGAANTAPSEFGDRPEQPLSAAVLEVDIPKWKQDPSNFNGDVASPIGGEFIDEFYARKAQELGRPYTEVLVYASGLRNTYDGVFHSNGNLYAPDNGLGVQGTFPSVGPNSALQGDPTDDADITAFGIFPDDSPGKQPDPLNLIEEGNYYGHPNPYRREVVFKEGSQQGLAGNFPPGHPEYTEPLTLLGTNKSANGIIEYTANNFFGQLKEDLLIANFSTGDDLTRVQLSGNGRAVTGASSLVSGFSDPLPLRMGPEGTIVVGEFTSSEITILEPLGTWRSDLPDAPATILDAGSATVDGKLHTVGGKVQASHVNDVYIYDPGDPLTAADDLWTAGPDYLAAVENPAVVEFGGQIYAFGGSTAPFSGAVTTAAVLNPNAANPQWTPLAGLPIARGGATAQVLDGQIYVIGGLDSNGNSVNSVDVYDPLTGNWSTAAPDLQTRRDNAGSAVVDGKLYVFGGRTRNADGSVVDATLQSLEIFDPLTGQWTAGTDMPTGRRALSVGTLNGRIQAIGGEAGPNGSAFDVTEEYNPATNTWRTLPSISTPRHGAAFGTIDDVVYVAMGGPQAGSAFTDVTEGFSL